MKTWEKTWRQNLVRNQSGGYYVRLSLNSKEVWKSLKTKHFSAAKARLAEAQKNYRQRRGTDKSGHSAAFAILMPKRVMSAKKRQACSGLPPFAIRRFTLPNCYFSFLIFS